MDIPDDRLYPLFAAVLKIDHTARYPCFNSLVSLFQYQEVAL